MTFPAIRRENLPKTTKCPDCGGTLAKRMNGNSVWVYECDDPKCELIELRLTPRGKQFNVKREARAGNTEAPPPYSEPDRSPKPCPGCGATVEAHQRGEDGKYVYRCSNMKCSVSRFKYDSSGKIIYRTHKTGQFYDFKKA